jgi:hypothetical protein
MGLLAVALVSAAACVEERILETQALVVTETLPCDAARGRAETINTYRVMLFEVAEGAPAEDRCGPCLREGRCTLREMVCGCGPSHLVPNTFEINRDLEGLRFRDLPPGIEICLGLVAADVPSLPPTDRREQCDCSTVITPDAIPRMCGASPISGTVEENAPAIVILAECRDRLPCALAAIPPP